MCLRLLTTRGYCNALDQYVQNRELKTKTHCHDYHNISIYVVYLDGNDNKHVLEHFRWILFFFFNKQVNLSLLSFCCLVFGRCRSPSSAPLALPASHRETAHHGRIRRAPPGLLNYGMCVYYYSSSATVYITQSGRVLRITVRWDCRLPGSPLACGDSGKAAFRCYGPDCHLCFCVIIEDNVFEKSHLGGRCNAILSLE